MTIRKSICMLTLMALLPIAGMACSKDAASEPVEPPKVSSPDETLVTYTVTGMTCSSCEGHVQEQLAKLPNVQKVVASHKDKKAWMIVKGDAPSKDDVEKAIKAAGANYKLGEQS